MDATEQGSNSRTACIFCSINCGLDVRVEDGHITRVKGDRQHPASAGYLCEKAQRLDLHQHGKDRIRTPLRRRDDGTFEAIDWDTAIREVASKLAAIRDRHGGSSIFYYGGGGQANHLGGTYATALQAALGVVYRSNALAQEKTGEFWVDGQLFGRPRCHTAGDFEHAEVAIFVGKNPWHSHGFPRARVVLKEIARDPARCLIVLDPRRTETAKMADIHLQLRPGTDAFCLTALIAALIQRGLVNRDFLAQRTADFDRLAAHFQQVDVATMAAHAGLTEAQIVAVAERIGRARSVSTYEDLGIQQSPHSTLCSWLEKLLYLLVGSFGIQGGMNIHTRLISLGGGGGGKRGARTPVTGAKVITGLVPCNVIPDEILTEHPDRFRAMIVDSANPAHSLAGSPRWRQALAALDLVVVLDVAMTETARQAHYILPSPSQLEKVEAAFFAMEFPQNAFQLRAPVLPPPPGLLGEPEIHRRLVRALGALDGVALEPLAQAALAGRDAFAMAFLGLVSTRPELMPLAPVILLETLGPTLPPGMEAAAVLWGIAQTCVMTYPESTRRAGFEGADALFDAMLANRSGITFSVDPYEATFERIVYPDGKIHLVIDDLLPELAEVLAGPAPYTDEEYPFVLSAGERRSSTTTTNLRDPQAREDDPHGALRISPGDAQRLGLSDGSAVQIRTRGGVHRAVIEISDTMQEGHVSLPNGTGLRYPGADGQEQLHGTPPNELTRTEDRDWLAGTPWHKHVPARIEALLPQDRAGALRHFPGAGVSGRVARIDTRTRCGAPGGAFRASSWQTRSMRQRT